MVWRFFEQYKNIKITGEMDMIIQSDWHIHTKCSHDALLSLDEIASKTKELGIKKFGVTDHVNFNDEKFLGDLKNSADYVGNFQKQHPEVILGVELTPIEKPEFDYIAMNGTRKGYVAPIMDRPYDIELAQTKEQLVKAGVRYAIGAAHWRVDVPDAMNLESDMDVLIREWYRQQMWLACDERVTILGHPWYNGNGIWYDDFSVIPRSMNTDIAAALKENKKYVECNIGILNSPKTSERFRIQYGEFLRELFEMGIPVTYGSDSHNVYNENVADLEKILSSVGFKDGDFSDLSEECLW